VSAARYLVILSEEDPVASLVRELLPMGEATGESVDGVPIRRLSEGVLGLHRPGLHIHDEHLDRRLPASLRDDPVPLVFPSCHRSEKGVRCFTVHSLGNFAEAEVGGEAARLNPSAPRLMTDALRRLQEAGEPIALPATFEATHHGPALDTSSVFVEIGFAEDAAPPHEAVQALARVILELGEDARDRVAVGVGGGHYAPHFTDLSLKRRWAFGHIVSRHALLVAPRETLESCATRTPGFEGYLFHRASDAMSGPGDGLTPKLTDGAAPKRAADEVRGPTTSGEDEFDPGAGT
jgi:D-aminoacyl-tRNA deacylase